jgi:hypothetical protein
MERDLTPRSDRTSPPDDDELGALVRAAAHDWDRPPQRLDQPTWRERVEVSGRGSRSSGGRRWFGRVAEAGVLAVVATVVLALGAVYLTSPGRNGTIGSNPSATPTEGASPTGPAVTPSLAPAASGVLPALHVDGPLPSVTRPLMTGIAGYQFVDLASGTVEPPLPWSGNGLSKVVSRPDGGFVCICFTFGQDAQNIDQLRVVLEAIDALGEPVDHVDLGVISVEPGRLTANPNGTKVDARVDLSPDGRYAFIGRSHQTPTGWSAGVDIVDLAALAVVDSVALPDVDHAAEAGGKPWTRTAPSVRMTEGRSAAVISNWWYVDDPTGSTMAGGQDRWTTTISGGGSAGVVVDAGSHMDEACWELERGVIDEATYFIVCIPPESGEIRVERLRLDGTLIDQTLPGRLTGAWWGFAQRGTMLYLWDATAHTLVRYDAASNEWDWLDVPRTGSVDERSDLFASLGRALGTWIAPTALAKILLEPTMAVSPDGDRLYAIGTEGASGGSVGVFAFDISGDEPVLIGNWPPNADYTSVAVSEDGAFVYAAGMAGVNVNGVAAPEVQASVTVFDASDGSIRLIAGQLGDEDLRFVHPVAR